MIYEGGTNYNLDLNLGMSTPSSADGRCGSNMIGYPPFGTHDAKRARMDNPVAATLGYEGGTIGKRVGVELPSLA
ncbi:hypothetical protein MKW98_014126 [Papaver atlanticum]|uniref:Uncharacterized protein n=1 Tax=Papaver atlanticum TaxID=357466 RepID=A0AAD4SLB3_9MAGN|nr:hypothetical protein MKW98_014126 [Papaver atlanticum]